MDDFFNRIRASLFNNRSRRWGTFSKRGPREHLAYVSATVYHELDALWRFAAQ